MKRRHLCILGLLASSTLASACGGDDKPSTTGGAAEAGTIIITASGEAPARSGYDFPFTTATPGFVDGWEVKFTEVLVTVDNITLSESPDTDPGNPSKTGTVVAGVKGPFAIDLHKGGPAPGKLGAGGQATPIAILDKQNKNGDRPFEAGKRYAFGFDIVPAAAGAQLGNLDDKGKADYAMMQQKG